MVIFMSFLAKNCAFFFYVFVIFRVFFWSTSLELTFVKVVKFFLLKFFVRTFVKFFRKR